MNSSLESSIDSLLCSTNEELSIYIVSNNGKSKENPYNKQIFYLAQKYPMIKGYVLCANYWVLSLNSQYVQQIMNDSVHYIVSDDDIIYPQKLSSGLCWVKHLRDTLKGNNSMGKIGLHVSDITKGANSFEERSDRFHNLSVNHKISEFIYHQPVDTTPALYRSRLFAPNSNRFSPRMNKLLMPGLVSTRTALFSCRSLSNADTSRLGLDKHRIIAKALCFTFVSAWLSSDNRKKTPFLYIIIYRLIRPITWLYWTLNAIGRRVQASGQLGYIFHR